MEQTTKFASRVQAEMKAQNVVAIKDLAYKSPGIKYESIRKCIVGDTIPSDRVLSAICNALKLNKHEMELLVEQDRIRSRMSREAFAHLSGMEPGVDTINDVWKDLNPQHREDLQTMARTYAKQDNYSKHEQNEHKRRRASA